MVKKAKAKAKKPVAKKKGPVVLPMVLSKLIAIALKDLRKVEKMKNKYAVNMGDWYVPNSDLICRVEDVVISKTKICSVCAAGSVMALSLGAKGTGYMDPSSFPKNMNQLHAINSLRTGEVVSAHNNLFPDAYVSSFSEDSESKKLCSLNTDIPEYEPMNPEPFHNAMVKLQAKLEKAGY